MVCCLSGTESRRPTSGLSTRVVELAGPAGAGKTTLLDALCTEAGSCRIVGLPTTRQCLRQLPRLIGPYLSASRRGIAARINHLEWAHVRSMAYLTAWPQVLRQPEHARCLALFDHGPAYRLAVLREFGPWRDCKSVGSSWWSTQLRSWSRRCSDILWLDQANTELLRRIGKRSQQHACQELADDAAADLLERYRKALQQVIEMMTQCNPKLRVLEIGGSSRSPGELAREVYCQLSLASGRDCDLRTRSA